MLLRFAHMEAGLLDMYSVIRKLSTQSPETDLAAQSSQAEVESSVVFYSGGKSMLNSVACAFCLSVSLTHETHGNHACMMGTCTCMCAYVCMHERTHA